MKRPLNVSLYAREPSVVEFRVGERVQVDRLTSSPHGWVGERHGRLLEPGINTVVLDAGHYFFKTLSDAHLRVIQGGVQTQASTQNKTNDPKLPPPRATDPAPLPVPESKGEELSGETPVLTVE